MHAEAEVVGGLPAAREPKLGFMSRRRRLRNRWNIHMRKDERAQAKAWAKNDAPDGAAEPAINTTELPAKT